MLRNCLLINPPATITNIIHNRFPYPTSSLRFHDLKYLETILQIGSVKKINMKQIPNDAEDVYFVIDAM